MIKSKYLGALVFFLVLVLALSVSAAEDFEVTVKSEAIDICKCVQGETSFKVKNTGDMVSFYYIELEGPAAEWVTILESEFMLEPLDEKTITMMVNVPCSGKSNNELLIHVITELNTATTVKQNLKLKTCSNSIVTTTTPKIINCPAATSTFAFTIENTGSYLETYSLSMEPFPERAILTDGILFLEPGEKQTVYSFVTMPPEFLETQEFTFKAKGTKSKVVNSLTVDLETKKCYNYTTNIPKTLSVCQHTTTSKPFEVVSDTEMSNEYQISLEGTDFVTMELNGSKLTYEFNTNAVELGSYLLTSNIKNKIGSIENSYKTNITVEDCYSLKLNALEAYKIVACEDNTLTFDVTNQGNKDGEYAFATESAGWIQPQPYLQIDSQETKQLKLFLNAVCEESWTGALLKAESLDSNYEFEKQISFELGSAEDAYKLSIDSQNQYISFHSQTRNITITHEGFKKATYNLDVLGPDWVTFSKSKLTLEPGESQTINYKINPPAELEFSKYKVDLTLSTSTVEYKDSFKVSVTNDPWWAQYWAAVLAMIIIIIALIILAIILIIRKATKRRKRSKLVSVFKSTGKTIKKNKRYFLAILIAIIVVVCLLLVKFLAMPPVTQEEPTYLDFDFDNLYSNGNTIYFWNDAPFAIPFKFTNPTDKEVFYNLEGPDYIDWIFPNKSWLSVPANGSEDLHLIVLGENKTDPVDYTLTVNEVVSGNKTKLADTTVTLQPISNIAKEYWWIVLLVPLILLIILILTFGLIKYSKTKKSKGLKFNKRRKWPWILLIIIIILIILAVVSWFTVFAPDAPAVHVDQYLDDNVKPSIAVDESNLQMLGNALILANEVVNLPIIVSNFHSEAASYEFMTTKTDWIEISKYNMTLKPAQSEVILLNIDARNQSKQELNYTILANIDVVGDQYLETTEFNIKITGLGKSKTRIIIFSIIVVLVILLVISIVFVVSTRKQKRLYRAVRLRRKNGK